MWTAELLTAPARMVPKADSPLEKIIGCATSFEQARKPGPTADYERRIAFPRLDHWIISRTHLVVRVLLGRGPFRPVAPRTLVDMIAQPAGFRRLHFGDELRAPQRFVQDVWPAIGIAVE